VRDIDRTLETGANEIFATQDNETVAEPTREHEGAPIPIVVPPIHHLIQPVPIQPTRSTCRWRPTQKMIDNVQQEGVSTSQQT
jgi:hypothetical protein